MTTNVDQNGYFPVSIPHNYDNGLGFGQGSTAGIYNQYYRGGFHRPQIPEFHRNDRNRFNNHLGCDSYKCHFNPASTNVGPIKFEEISKYYETPLDKCDECDNPQNHTDLMKASIISLESNNYSSKITSQINTVFFAIIAIIFFFFLFGNKSL